MARLGNRSYRNFNKYDITENFEKFKLTEKKRKEK